MPRTTVYMGSTDISVEKTAAEITQELHRMQVSGISYDYENNKISAMRFSIKTGAKDTWYRLPIRVAHVYAAMKKKERVSEAQAERTAWRQVLRWIQAQLALVEVNASTPFEVMMPYMLDEDGQQTLGEAMSKKRGVPLLPLLT